MNKNVTPLILIILGLGVFFTFTNGRITEIQSLQVVNDNYLKAINNSVALIQKRDAVLTDYNSLSDDNKTRLNKLLPDNVDNVRLIIDVTNIASRHGIPLKSISTNAQTGSPSTTGGTGVGGLGTVTVSFSFSASYANFLSFLTDIQSSLRILDISHLTVLANDTGTYDYTIALQTYWLK